MEGRLRGGHSHTAPLMWGSGTPLFCAREHAAWGGRQPKHRARVTCGQGQSPPYFFHLVLATSFLVPARRHTGERFWKALQEALQQTDLRTLGKLSFWGARHTPVRQPTSQSPPGAQEQTDLQCECVCGVEGVNVTDPASRGAS